MFKHAKTCYNPSILTLKCDSLLCHSHEYRIKKPRWHGKTFFYLKTTTRDRLKNSISICVDICDVSFPVQRIVGTGTQGEFLESQRAQNDVLSIAFYALFKPKVFKSILSEAGARAGPPIKSINNFLSNQFWISRLLETLIQLFVKFSCEAPEMFCWLWKLTMVVSRS